MHDGRAMVRVRHGMAASSQVLATKVGREIRVEGGTAADGCVLEIEGGAPTILLSR